MKRFLSVFLMVVLLSCTVLPVMAEQSPLTSQSPVKIRAGRPCKNRPHPRKKLKRDASQ